MKFNSFEEILAYQKSEQLALKIYTLLRDCNDFGFKNQIQRAVVSISNNIAEGFERKGNKEFRQFLFIAKGSCGEVRSMLRLSLKLNYVSEGNFNVLHNLSVEVSKMLSGLIKKL